MLYQPTNLAGPSRTAQIQQMVQNAAQNVFKRQRMRALIQSGVSKAAGGQGGSAVPFRSSLQGHATGFRGAVARPNLSQQQLAQMLRGAGTPGQAPGGGIGGGMFSGGGGGTDFGAVPDPTDYGQSPQSLGPVQSHDPYALPPVGAHLTTPDGHPYVNDNANPTAGQPPSNPPIGTGAESLPPDGDQPSGGAHGWVPLGNGVFYDPTYDIVRGQPLNEVSSIDRKF